MAEYIEREALTIENLEKYMTVMEVNTKEYGQQVVIAVDDLMYLPTADVVEVRHGKWIENQEPLGWCDVDCAECSVCHESWIIDEDSSIDDYECMWHYCPHCGAKMDGGNNNA